MTPIPNRPSSFCMNIFLVALLLAGAFPEALPAQSQIYKKKVITQPGSYVLTRDITISSGEKAIDIQANNVTINLNRHRISGPADATTYAVYSSGFSNIHIFNGTIDGTWAVFFEKDGGHFVVRNMTIMNSQLGIWINSPSVGAYGNVHLIQNRILDPLWEGIYVLSARGGAIHNNEVTDPRNGIYCTDVHYLNIMHNRVTGAGTISGWRHCAQWHQQSCVP